MLQLHDIYQIDDMTMLYNFSLHTVFRKMHSFLLNLAKTRKVNISTNLLAHPVYFLFKDQNAQLVGIFNNGDLASCAGINSPSYQTPIYTSKNYYWIYDTSLEGKCI